MKIYLSKSNRCNPNHVMMVRQELKDVFPNDQVVEFEGGSYDRRILEGADKIVMVAEARPKIIEQDRIIKVDIGRGLYTEAELGLAKGPKKTYYCLIDAEIDSFTLHEVQRTVLTDIDKWTRYGVLLADMDLTPLADLRK
jgi:hypothetical protein